MNFYLREAAERDLADILAYGARLYGGPDAIAFLRTFDQAFVRLAMAPRLYSRVEGADGSFRSYSHRGYRVFYVVEQDIVAIVRVLHHTRDHPRHLS